MKKTCSYFTLAVGVQREMGLGFFRDLDIAEMGLGIFEGLKVERGGELSLVSRVLIDRKSTRLNSSHVSQSRMPSSA